MYLYVRMDAWDILTTKWKQYPSTGDDASTADVAPSRVGRGTQGEARRANSTPNGGPHLELGCLRLKTWSKPYFSIAQTTGPTYLYMCFYKPYSQAYTWGKYVRKRLTNQSKAKGRIGLVWSNFAGCLLEIGIELSILNIDFPDVPKIEIEFVLADSPFILYNRDRRSNTAILAPNSACYLAAENVKIVFADVFK